MIEYNSFSEAQKHIKKDEVSIYKKDKFINVELKKPRTPKIFYGRDEIFKKNIKENETIKDLQNRIIELENIVKELKVIE